MSLVDDAMEQVGELFKENQALRSRAERAETELAEMKAIATERSEACARAEAERDQVRRRVAELEEEGVDRMAERFLAETRIKALEVRDGASLELEPSRELAAIWVGAARGLLGDAPNYTETRVDVPTGDGPTVSMEVTLAGDVQRYAFTLQRVGGLTPHEARKAAEAERDQLRAAAKEASGLLWNADLHPAPVACLGRLPSISSECGVCRARAILRAALGLDQPAKETE